MIREKHRKMHEMQDSNRVHSDAAEDFSTQGRADEVFEDSYLGIVGRPGQDYPVYSDIPRTSFSCRDQSFNGIFADPETQCQVFHMCQPQGFVNSFLCPNGTIFNQQVFVCDWWYNVDCATSNSYYNLNSNIYAKPAREVDNDLDAERRHLEERNEPTQQTIPFSKVPATERPVSRRPVAREPAVTRYTPRTRGTQREFTRPAATRAPFTQQPTRAPYSRPTTRYEPVSVTQRPVARNPPPTVNPYIVAPDSRRRTLVTDEPNIITRPTARPISVGRAITVTEHKGRLRPDPLPIVIPRQRIQLQFPAGFGQRINRRVETAPIDSFEDILNLEPIDNSFSGRRGRGSASFNEDVEDILLAFPGPRRVR
ncbi:hypothetical protein GQR58_020609 [Nymphon striatum]|nr:hypothetical protein GQR58_020609 [Nymphon striatum]